MMNRLLVLLLIASAVPQSDAAGACPAGTRGPSGQSISTMFKPFQSPDVSLSAATELGLKNFKQVLSVVKAFYLMSLKPMN